MPRKTVTAKSKGTARTRSSATRRKKNPEVTGTGGETPTSKAVETLRSKDNHVAPASDEKGSRSRTRQKAPINAEVFKSVNKQNSPAESEKESKTPEEAALLSGKQRSVRKPSVRVRVATGSATLSQRADETEGKNKDENKVHPKVKPGKRRIVPSKDVERPRKKLKSKGGSLTQNELHSKPGKKEDKKTRGRKKRKSRSRNDTSPERLRNAVSGDEGDDYEFLPEALQNLPPPQEGMMDALLDQEPPFLFGTPIQQQPFAMEQLNTDYLQAPGENGSGISGILAGQPASLTTGEQNVPAAGQSPIGASFIAPGPPAESMVLLWVGVFVSNEDENISSLDVFNGLQFNLILEAENGGGDAQRFVFTEHKFGTSRLAKISQRLADAFSILPFGRFFPVLVPVHKPEGRNTVYNCALSFPSNDVTPTNQSGLVFPRYMRFCTRVVCSVPGAESKTDLTFQPFFGGEYFYHLSASRKVHHVCSFIIKDAQIWFPKSFAQQPARKMSGNLNTLMQQRLDINPLLAVCRSTLDPIVPFLRHMRPKFNENVNEKGEYIEGGRPKRKDNRDLLTSRRACLEVLRVQNNFIEVPKPRRGYVIAHGDPVPGLLVLKRQEVGDMLNVKATWLSTHLKECGMPCWPGVPLMNKAGKLRGMLIRLHVATEYIITVISANLDKEHPFMFPAKTMNRVRRIRRKIRAYRRDRRLFVGQFDQENRADSGDSMDEIPNDGLQDNVNEAGQVTGPNSDNEFEQPNGAKQKDTALSATKSTYFTEDFLNPWRDLSQSQKDFMLDPMWECVLPWRNQPLEDGETEMNEGDHWMSMPESLPNYSVHRLVDAHCDQQLVTDANAVVNSFNTQDSDTDASATEGLSEITNDSMRIATTEECTGNFVLGGERRRAKFNRRRGRVTATGHGQKRVYRTPTEFANGDRLAQRIRMDLLEAYGTSITIPNVINKYEDYLVLNQQGFNEQTLNQEDQMQ